MKPCDSRFAALASSCNPSQSDPAAVTTDAFGQDPAYNPYSVLFKRNNNGLLPEYYNTSEGSPDMTAFGVPYGFSPTPSLGLEPGFSVMFPVRPHSLLSKRLLPFAFLQKSSGVGMC